VIALLPSGRESVVKVATPFASVPVPIVDPFDWKVMVPVGVPLVNGVTVAVKVTDTPKPAVGSDETTCVVVPALFVVRETAAEALPVKLLEPAYVAVMEFVPTGAAEVASVATPEDRTAVPTLWPLIRNVTLPVGVPPVEVTVAVSVTVSPKLDGLGETFTLVADAAFVMFSSTAGEVLVRYVVSPAYIAVRASFPAGRVATLSVATSLLLSAPVPSSVPPLKKLTLPVGVPLTEGFTLAVNTTGLP
jgi:hypothetical protein